MGLAQTEAEHMIPLVRPPGLAQTEAEQNILVRPEPHRLPGLAQTEAVHMID